MGVVPTLDKTEKGDASLGLGAKGIAINEFAFQSWSYPGLVDSFGLEISGRSFHLFSKLMGDK